MNDLVAFLNARLDEKGRDAREMAKHYPPPWEVSDRGWMARVVADEPNFWDVVRLEPPPGTLTSSDAPWLGDVIRHVANWDPARVLADVAAKRRIVERYAETERRADSYIRNGLSSEPDDEVAERLALEWCCQMLALPDADHPDFDPSWGI